MNSQPLINTLDLRHQVLSAASLRDVLPRVHRHDAASVEAQVQGLMAQVRDHGWSAIADLAAKFDGVQLAKARVAQESLDSALAELDSEVRAALEESIARARVVASAQMPGDVSVELASESSVNLSWRPVERVGVYVPGGLAVYPSSVVMNVVPAQAAGVQSIALFSPPQKDFGGLPHPTILAAAAMLGVSEVYAIGGAQAVISMAYGLPANSENAALEPVNLITGPGNIYVATAKRLVKGVVGIDAEAGPTEIAIIADDSANPRLVAADMISQAEHDPFAAAVLITDSFELACSVEAELESQVQKTKHQQRVREALKGDQSAVVLVDDLDAAITAANVYAAEHLEIMTRDAIDVASRISSAGAIFVGDDSPVSLGDYCAGSNHVLPTSGTAAFSSGLGVYSFLKAVQVISYDHVGLAQVAGHVQNLANAEDLPAHGDAVARRFE